MYSFRSTSLALASVRAPLVGSRHYALFHGRSLAGRYSLAAEFDCGSNRIRVWRNHLPLRFFKNSAEKHPAHLAVAEPGLCVCISGMAKLPADSNHDDAWVRTAPFLFSQGTIEHDLFGDRYSLDF